MSPAYGKLAGEACTYSYINFKVDDTGTYVRYIRVGNTVILEYIHVLYVCTFANAAFGYFEALEDLLDPMLALLGPF